MEILAPIIQNFLNKHQYVSWFILLMVGVYFSIIFVQKFINHINEVKFIKLNNLKKLKEEYLKNINTQNNNNLLKDMQEFIDSIIINEIFQKVTGLKISNNNRRKLFLNLIKNTSYNYEYIKHIFPYIKLNETNNNDFSIQNINIEIKKQDYIFYILFNFLLIFPYFLFMFALIILFLIGNWKIVLFLWFLAFLLIYIFSNDLRDVYLALKFEKNELRRLNKRKNFLLYLPNLMIIIGIFLGTKSGYSFVKNYYSNKTNYHNLHKNKQIKESNTSKR